MFAFGRTADEDSPPPSRACPRNQVAEQLRRTCATTCLPNMSKSLRRAPCAILLSINRRGRTTKSSSSKQPNGIFTSKRLPRATSKGKLRGLLAQRHRCNSSMPASAYSYPRVPRKRSGISLESVSTRGEQHPDMRPWHWLATHLQFYVYEW